MRTNQLGKGLVPLVLLIAGVVVVVMVLVTQLNKNNYQPSPTTYPGQKSGSYVAKKGGVVSMMLTPADVSVSEGQTFNIDVGVDTKTEMISAAEIHISFDPAYLEASSVQAGTYLPVVLTSPKVVGNDASIVVGANPTAPKKGSGVLATVMFKAKKKTSEVSKIMVGLTTQVAAIGKNGNVLGPTVGTNVTIK